MSEILNRVIQFSDRYGRSVCRIIKPEDEADAFEMMCPGTHVVHSLDSLKAVTGNVCTRRNGIPLTQEEIAALRLASFAHLHEAFGPPEVWLQQAYALAAELLPEE